MEKSKCRGCRKDIIWASTTSGVILPLDAEPDATGELGLIDGKAFTVAGGLLINVYEGPRYTSHLATCQFVKMLTEKPLT